MLTKPQWLCLHEVCLDTVRGAPAGLSADKLAAQPSRVTSRPSA